MEPVVVGEIIAASSDFSWVTLILWLVAAAFLVVVVLAYRWAMRRADEDDEKAPIMRRFRM